MVESEEDESDRETRELETEFEKELCDLWDMSVERDVCLVLEQFNAIAIFDGFVRKFDAVYPRACEILVGVLVKTNKSSILYIPKSHRPKSQIVCFKSKIGFFKRFNVLLKKSQNRCFYSIIPFLIHIFAFFKDIRDV
jgi:hypothetical protein